MGTLRKFVAAKVTASVDRGALLRCLRPRPGRFGRDVRRRHRNTGMMALSVFLSASSSVALRPASSLPRLAASRRMPAVRCFEDAASKGPEMAGGDMYTEMTSASYLDGARPAPSWELAAANFQRQSRTIVRQAAEKVGLAVRDAHQPPDCLGLTLSNEAVYEAERRREEAGGRVDAHPVSRGLYDLGCLLLDNLFDERPIQRFWFLEIIARIPYFAYVSMLHLYESLGWWRGPELRKVHNAEEWNELHHLLIMESLGGNALWSDRFLGYHVAIAYYWFLIVVYFFSPAVAYQFMELLEAHAVDTYSTFVSENRERLASLPAPSVARSYYGSGDLYYFDDFQVSRPPGSRRPACETLLHIFSNIAEDEGEHVKTMQACQDYARLGSRVVSPHAHWSAHAPTTEDEATRGERRKQWKRWAAEVNARK